jgi:hypothetical protein
MAGVVDRPRWGLYDPPAATAVIDDLQALRQATTPISGTMVRQRYALFHLPFLVDVADLDGRARMLVEALREVVTHPLLTPEQQIIARWILFPPADAAQRLLHERRGLASSEIASRLADRNGTAITRTRKQIEDRESRILAVIAQVLIDRHPASAGTNGSRSPIVAQPPIDPYEGKGYVWLDSEHRLTFDENDPRVQTLRYSVVIQAVRRDQRLFWMRHDAVMDGDELPIEVVSSDAGHVLLGRVDDPRPQQARAHLLFFYLGRTLAVGDTTRLVYERRFRQSSAAQPWFAMEMDDTPQDRLLLEVFLPAGMRISSWTREEWTGSSGDAACVERERFDATSDVGTWARYEILDTTPRHTYRITWD